jgi:hypothetical protein
MNLDHLAIIVPFGIVGLAGGLLLIKETRRFRLRRDKARANQLHQELSELRKAMEGANEGTDLASS